MKAQQQRSRRRFLATSAAISAAPWFVPASSLGGQGRVAPSDKVVVGSIGTGDLGRRHHLQNKLLPNPRIAVAAVCDVDRHHRELAALECYRRTQKVVGVYKDFRQLCERRDIDAVLIAVPDHWHALCAVYAMETGKDVYCEKPLTLTIEEGQKMVAAARRYGAVVQTGSQQRSEGPFAQAIELVRNHKIGKLSRIDTYIGGIDAGTWVAPTTPPPELDWDMWLGPAPFAEYAPNRCHYQFRWFSDYSGGKMTDWGAHHNDVAQWALGMDESGPVKIKGVGKFHENGPHDVPGEFDVAYTYANGVEVHCHSAGENGVKITGSEGWIFVSRSRIDASNKELLKWKPGSGDFAVPRNRGHHANWLDCIATRERPICDVAIGHRSATVCHLGNIAMALGRELHWDPAKEQFVNDEAANRLVRKPMRSPWRL